MQACRPCSMGADVGLCGQELTNRKRGAHRIKEFGVYPQTAFKDFMIKLKSSLNDDDTLGGKMYPHARDEAHAKFHVRYIVDHTFKHPSDSAGECERLLTCLYYPLDKWLQNNPES